MKQKSGRNGNRNVYLLWSVVNRKAIMDSGQSQRSPSWWFDCLLIIFKVKRITFSKRLQQNNFVKICKRLILSFFFKLNIINIHHLHRFICQVLLFLYASFMLFFFFNVSSFFICVNLFVFVHLYSLSSLFFIINLWCTVKTKTDIQASRFCYSDYYCALLW